MKKRTKLIAASLSALVIISGVGIGASVPVGGVTKANYTFEINGENLKLPPNLLVFSKNNTTYVPLRFLSESLGADVGYKQGTITVSGLERKSEESQTDKEKLAKAVEELELVKKQNESLKKQIQISEQLLEDKNVYKELPITVESNDGFKVRLNQIASKDDTSTSYKITILNEGTNRIFELDPSKTQLVIGSDVYMADDYTTELSSSVVSPGSPYAKSLYNGEIVFKHKFNKNDKGNITLFYTSNVDDQVRSFRIFFDNAK